MQLLNNIYTISTYEVHPEIKFQLRPEMAGQSPAEIHHQLCHMYGPDIMSDSVVRRWCGQVTEGRTNVHDEDRSGRPSLVTPELMESVRKQFSRTGASQFRKSLITSLDLDVGIRLL